MQSRVLPLRPDRCRIEFDDYHADDPQALARADDDLRFSDEIQRQDIRICEAVQRGLGSGAYTAGRLCPRRERGVWHFHQLLRAAHAAWAAMPAAAGCA